MLSQLRPALALFLLLTFITGVVYPLGVTAIAQVAFTHKANGSLVRGADGVAVGSSLVGQDFSAGDPLGAARWFWGRLSATSPAPYTALNLEKGTGSSGSNLALTNPALLESARARVDALAAADRAVGVIRSPGSQIPVDLVTASGSGLDPHVSLAAAEYQVPRVSKARGMSEEVVRDLVRNHTVDRLLGVLGEPVVNVLELNLDLERRQR